MRVREGLRVATHAARCEVRLDRSLLYDGIDACDTPRRPRDASGMAVRYAAHATRTYVRSLRYAPGFACVVPCSRASCVPTVEHVGIRVARVLDTYLQPSFTSTAVVK
eukprot:4990346-Pleurochrysis_carterae.AAC.2